MLSPTFCLRFLNPAIMYQQAINIWFTFYKFHTGENYIFSGKDGKHLKELLKKVKLKTEERGLEPTEENVLNNLKMFLNTVKDPWILSHLEVALINSKFNSLYVSAIKNSPLGIERAIDNAIRKYGIK